jgi:hypothetical protein
MRISPAYNVGQNSVAYDMRSVDTQLLEQQKFRGNLFLTSEELRQ